MKTPDPEHIGAYRIVGELGRGGMGVVYRAVHEQSGQQVALKTLAGLASEAYLDGIRREIEALRSLSHPGVVQILDAGLEASLPWYAMELVEGESLADWMSAGGAPGSITSGTNPGPPPATNVESEPKGFVTSEVEIRIPSDIIEAFERDQWDEQGYCPLIIEAPTVMDVRSYLLAARDAGGLTGAVMPQLNLLCLLCDGLAYMHGEGVVHCDLKPQNILVRPNGMPVLVDFGLTGRFTTGREAIGAADLMAGSVLYMSPEQIEGDLVDPRTDLYALGCVLYEILSGEPPFLADTPHKVMMAHLSRAPGPLSHLGIPPQLEELVLTLLEKDPRRRIGHADIVAARLRDAGVTVPQSYSRPHKTYLYRPRIAGRDAEVRVLRGWMDHVERAESQVGLVGGESGVGKTRLLMELARSGRARRWRVFTTASSPRSGTDSGGDRAMLAPFGMLQSVLQAIGDHCRELGPAGVERILGERLKWLAPYAPSLTDLQASPEDDAAELSKSSPAQAASQVFDALAETLAALAREAPMLLLVDDIQWADAHTLAFLERLARKPVPAPVLVVGSYRSDEMHEGLQRVIAGSTASRLELGRLELSHIRRLVADMLAVDKPPAQFVRVLTERSNGNPYFVAEYLHEAVNNNILRRDAMGRWQVRTFTEGGGRIDFSRLPLPPTLKDLVEARLDGLSELARRAVASASVLGRELYSPFVCRMTGLSEEELHKAVWELIRHNILEHREGKVLFSQETVRYAAYQQLDPDLRRILHASAAEVMQEAARIHTMDHAVIAEHFRRAELPERARSHYLKAAGQARSRFDLDDAERLYRAYLEVSPELDRERYLARQEFARNVLFQRRSIVKALEQMLLFEAEARQMEDIEGRAVALRMSSVLHRYQGELELAESKLQKAALLATRIGNDKALGQVLNTLGNLQREMSLEEAAVQSYERSLKLARKCGDQPLEAIALGNLALSVADMGDVDKGLVCLKQSLEIHIERKDLDSQSMAMTNLASLLRRQGSLRSAETAYRKALTYNQKVDNPYHEATSCAGLGACLRDQGSLNEALHFGDRSAELMHGLEHMRAEGAALLLVGEVQLALGQIQEAAATLRRATGLVETLDQARDYLQLCEQLRGRIALVRDDLDTASEAFRLSIEHGDSLPSPSPLNRETRSIALEITLRRGPAQAVWREAGQLLVDLLGAHLRPDVRRRALLRVVRSLRRSGAASSHIQGALAPLAEVEADQDPVAAAMVAFERGHLAMAAGQPPDAAIATIPPLFEAVEAAPFYEANQARLHFDAAVDAYRRGQKLVHGDASLFALH